MLPACLQSGSRKADRHLDAVVRIFGRYVNRVDLFMNIPVIIATDADGGDHCHGSVRTFVKLEIAAVGTQNHGQPIAARRGLRMIPAVGCGIINLKHDLRPHPASVHDVAVHDDLHGGTASHGNRGGIERICGGIHVFGSESDAVGVRPFLRVESVIQGNGLNGGFVRSRIGDLDIVFQGSFGGDRSVRSHADICPYREAVIPPQGFIGALIGIIERLPRVVGISRSLERKLRRDALFRVRGGDRDFRRGVAAVPRIVAAPIRLCLGNDAVVALRYVGIGGFSIDERPASCPYPPLFR